MKRSVPILIYLFYYLIFGMLMFLAVFGYNESLNLLVTPALSKKISGLSIFLSIILATAIVFLLVYDGVNKSFKLYAWISFYIGNLSLLFFFYIGFLLEPYAWQFPYTLMLPIFTFMFLIFSYAFFGSALLAIIPALLSGLMTYFTVEYFLRRKIN